MDLCLFEPEIPQNAGSLVRLCSCFGIKLNIIDPASFILDDRLFRRSGMDYIKSVDIIRYSSFEKLKSEKKRIILLDTKATKTYCDAQFREDDTIMVGSESCGVPDMVFEQCDEKLLIPMIPGKRSINIALSAAIALCEAMRQTGMFHKISQMY